MYRSELERNSCWPMPQIPPEGNISVGVTWTRHELDMNLTQTWHKLDTNSVQSWCHFWLKYAILKLTQLELTSKSLNYDWNIPLWVLFSTSPHMISKCFCSILRLNRSPEGNISVVVQWLRGQLELTELQNCIFQSKVTPTLYWVGVKFVSS